MNGRLFFVKAFLFLLRGLVEGGGGGGDESFVLVMCVCVIIINILIIGSMASNIANGIIWSNNTHVITVLVGISLDHCQMEFICARCMFKRTYSLLLRIPKGINYQKHKGLK